MTNETFFRDGLPRVDPDWIGSYNILVFLMACPANILFLVAIFFEKQMWRMSAYQIIFHMSFVHFILSISTLELGLIALLSRTCLFGDYTVAIGSIISYFGPISLCVLSSIQALNRLTAIAQISCLTNCFFERLLWLSWLLILASGLAVIFTGTIFTYRTDDFLYHFYNEQPSLNIFFYFTLIFLATGVLFYSLAVCSIILRRGSTQKRDVALLIQGMIPFFYLALVRSLQTWTFDNTHMLYIIFLSLAFRSLPLVHVGVYLTFNITVRDSLMKLLRLKKKNNAIPALVTQAPVRRGYL